LLVERTIRRRLVIAESLGDRWDEPFRVVQVELLSAAIDALRRRTASTLSFSTSRCPTATAWKPFSPMHAHAGDVPIVVLSAY